MNRRFFLQSAVSSLVLPTLWSAMPKRAWANESGETPLRMIFWYVPNGIVMNQWTPSRTGKTMTYPESSNP